MSSTSATAASHAPCPPSGARMVASNAQARVFTLAPPPALGRLLPSKRLFYGCLVRGGGAFELEGSRSPFTVLSHVALNGTTIAFASRRMGTDFADSTISTLELRSHRHASRAAWTFLEPGQPESFYTVTDLALDRDGVLAWIVRRSGISGAASYQVDAASRKGPTSVLANGTTIVPGSLRLSHGVVSWRQGGAGRTATAV